MIRPDSGRSGDLRPQRERHEDEAATTPVDARRRSGSGRASGKDARGKGARPESLPQSCDLGLDADGPSDQHRVVDDDEDLDPREAARVKRRDHEAEAERRELLRPGMGKVYKQIADTWEREATRPPKTEPRHKNPRD